MAKDGRIGSKCPVEKVFGRKNALFLQALHHASPQQRRSFLQHADKDLIRCIGECCLNILNAKIPLKPKEKSKLSKHKNNLRTLSKKKTSLTQKKKIITQKGGALLPLILAPVISALLSNLF